MHNKDLHKTWSSQYRRAALQLLELLTAFQRCRTKSDYLMLRAKFLARAAVLEGVAKQLYDLADLAPDEIRRTK